jgi:hypothetical protein
MVVEGVAPAVVEGVAPVAPPCDQGFPSTEARKQTADCGLTVTPPSASGGPRHLPQLLIGLPLRLFYLPLPLSLLCCKLGLQYLIQKLEYKAIICKYQWTTKTTEITWNCSFNVCVAVGHLCMGGAELVPLSRDRTAAS